MKQINKKEINKKLGWKSRSYLNYIDWGRARKMEKQNQQSSIVKLANLIVNGQHEGGAKSADRIHKEAMENARPPSVRYIF